MDMLHSEGAEIDSETESGDLGRASTLIGPPTKMMEEMNVATDESYDSMDERPAERWAPLGAAVTTPVPGSMEEPRWGTSANELEQLRRLEDEQEQLNSSLFALTSHFAQVQFRLKQIVDAPPDEKELKLKELEEFAFKGIPDVRSYSVPEDENVTAPMKINEEEYDHKIMEQRQKQQELILQLKSQLQDLETYAYEMGEADLPTNMMVEKQKVIIDQLRNKLQLDLDDFSKLSSDELRHAVDKAIGQIVNPAKVKEKLVDQLKTQITDLERFISFLQGEAQSPGPLGVKCTCAVHGKPFSFQIADANGTAKTPAEKLKDAKENTKKVHETTLSIMKQALTVLQIFAISQFGCGGKEFQRNLLKRTSKGNHWGDLRAKLEVAVNNVIERSQQQEGFMTEESEYTSDSEDAPTIQCNQELVTAVRKELAMALRDLMQHGLMEIGQSTSLVPFGCFSSRAPKGETKIMHAWDIFLKYYEMKHGKEYNDSTARKLSDSFDLDIVGGKAITAKQTLLSAIHSVLSSHQPLKRSEDSQLKAFVCLALNERKLVPWLRLVLRTNSLIEFYYQPWSYVVKTGFDDALQSLDKLSKIHFNLPVDLAVRPFKNIKDAF